MDESTKFCTLKKLFTKRFHELTTSLSNTGFSNLHVEPQVTKWLTGNEIEFTIAHPSDRHFDILVAISDEIVVVFSDFHTHHNNIPDEGPLEQVVEDAIDQIRLLLTADKIIITKWLKGKGVYKNVIEVEHNGRKKVVEDFYIGSGGLLFFIPTIKVVTTTTFK